MESPACPIRQGCRRPQRNFRRFFKGTLDLALAVYPEAQVDVMERGLTLKPSKPPVAPGSSRWPPSGSKPAPEGYRVQENPCTQGLRNAGASGGYKVQESLPPVTESREILVDPVAAGTHRTPIPEKPGNLALWTSSPGAGASLGVIKSSPQG